MKNEKKIILIIIIVLLLILLTFLTSFYGNTDIGDYSDTAKYFAGLYPAKIRNSHSYIYGLLHSPFVKLTNNFIFFKVTSLLSLLLIIYSVYFITKDSRSFLLLLLSPITWYMAPWINPIQLSALSFLWAYYFINTFDNNKNIKNLILSGLLIGIGWAIWDTILYFGVFLAFVFLIDKKFYYSVIFSLFVLIGLAPRLILDQLLFNFAFFTTIKTFLSGIVNLSGGIYGRAGHSPKTISTIIMLFLSIPIYYWSMYKPKTFKKNYKTMIFLTLSILLLVLNPQARYTLVLLPIISILLLKNLKDFQIKRQILISIPIILLFIFPYCIQVFYSIDNSITGQDTTYLLQNNFNVKYNDYFISEILSDDIINIHNDYPDDIYVVGNTEDAYQVLADLYWDSDIQEFVSHQDYILNLNDQTLIYQKTFMPIPNINNRRQIWISGGINKNINDNTDYDSIKYAIGLYEPVDLEGFELVKEYNFLYLSVNNNI